MTADHAVRPFGFTWGSVVVTSFAFWIFYSLAYLVLTHVTFRHATAAELRDWLRATTPTRRSQRIEASLGGGGPSANAHWSVLAMIAVGRSVVTGQTIIAFVFSTFVIAMLLSVIFLSG